MSDLTVPDPGESPFDAIRRLRVDGVTEYWSARDLMPLLGYDRWENFSRVVGEARRAAEIVGAQDQFRDSAKMIETGKGARREVADAEMTRYGAYLVAMSCDGRKSEVAAAKTYFAVRTREAETRSAAPALRGPELLAAAVLESQRIIEQRDARIAQQDSQLAVQAPKVAYVDTYVADSDLLSFSTVASANRITEKALRELLIERGWIYRQEETRWSDSKGKKETRYRYTEKASHKRHFRRVEVHEAPRFRGEVMHTLKVTPQGAEAIARLVAKEQAA